MSIIEKFIIATSREDMVSVANKLPLQAAEGVGSMYKEDDKSKSEQVLVCEETRCDSEDTSCSENCELIEKTEKIVP